MSLGTVLESMPQAWGQREKKRVQKRERRLLSFVRAADDLRTERTLCFGKEAVEVMQVRKV